jgi:hypothetical protein
MLSPLRYIQTLKIGDANRFLISLLTRNVAFGDFSISSIVIMWATTQICPVSSLDLVNFGIELIFFRVNVTEFAELKYALVI